MFLRYNYGALKVTDIKPVLRKSFRFNRVEAQRPPFHGIKSSTLILQSSVLSKVRLNWCSFSILIRLFASHVDSGWADDDAAAAAGLGSEYGLLAMLGRRPSCRAPGRSRGR